MIMATVDIKQPVLKPCPHCHKSFNGEQGVRVHIARAHQEISRRKTTQKYTQSSQTVPKLVDSSDSTTVVDYATTTIPKTPMMTEDRRTSADPMIPSGDGNLSRTPDPVLASFQNKLNALLIGGKDTQALDLICVGIQEHLAKAIDILPGPKHPASKFYKARKRRESLIKNKGYSATSNPQRARIKRSEASRDQYRYEKVQFEYYNRRRKAWKTIAKKNQEESCKLPINVVQDHFDKLLVSENPSVRSSYERPLPLLLEVDKDYSEIEIKAAMKGIAVDTAPGQDRVLMRTIKELSCAKIISLIASLMQKWSHVPPALKVARAVLIHKGGDVSDVNNWRAVMIFSIIRRIIERAIDGRIRKQFQPCAAQRGFVATPGTHINSTLINGVLRAAKDAGRRSSPSRKDCTVIFLDVSKAFDNIGHDHIRRSLESLPFSKKQCDLIMLLVSDNSVQIEVNRKKTKKILIKRGVPQGAPLSPMLFNIAIDFILKDLTEETIAINHGYPLMPGEKPLSGLGFADDTAVVGKSKESALVLAQIVVDGLREVGLKVNCKKSKAIVIEEGKLQSHVNLQTANGEVISTLKMQERVKYLGVNFEDEIVLDKGEVIRLINENLDLLVATPLLKPNQKHNIINQFIWPSVVYPLQNAPLKNLTKEFLKDIDVGIRGAVKQILMIPMDSPDAMLYASRRLRGLGIVFASWEAFLQHYSICCKLERIDDPILRFCRDFQNEKEECLKHLAIKHPEGTLSGGESSQQLRAILRLNMFEVWCALPSKGLGVKQFADYPSANSWMVTGEGLTSSQWTSAIKMNSNCCATRGTKGRFAGPDSCRYPNCMKKETLCHVLQDCPHSSDVVTARHNRVVNIMEQGLLNKGFEVHKEVHCTDGNGNRRVDLVVLDRQSITSDVTEHPGKCRGFLVDPTIRFEQNCDQALDVHHEKCSIYDSTHPYFREKYPDIEEWLTIGLFIGSRGTITKFFVDNFIYRFGLSKSIIKDIVRSVISDSVSLLNFHLFSITR